MKRRTQNILYHTLPIAFWLLAGLGSALSFFLIPSLRGEWIPYICPAILTLISVMIIRYIRRHSSSVEQCFQVAVLLGIASYWLPSVLFLIPPVWIYLITRNLYSFRSFLSTLIGLALVAVWMLVLNQISDIHYPLSLTKNLWGWIPTGSVLFAYIASTIVQQNLRVR